MLSILLIILKVIGIIILILLGLVLLVAGLILLVPVRYSISATYYSSKPEILLKVSWLLKMLRVRLTYKDELSFNVKILFFTLFSIPSSKNSVRVNDEKKYEDDVWSEFSDEKEEMTVENRAITEDKAVTEPKEESGNEMKKSAETEPVSESSSHEQGSNVKDVNSNGDSDSDSKIFREKNNIINCIKKKLAGIITKLKIFFVSIKEKKDYAMKKLDEIKDMLTDEDNRELVHFLISQLKRALKKLKPKKFRLKLHAGFDDPEATGKFAAAAGIAYGFWGESMEVYPDFEEKVIEGEVYLKGKLRLISLLVTGIRIYRNKHFRKKILQRIV